MTAKTISATNGAITLSSTNYYIPLSITSTGAVTNASGSAIYSKTAKSWIITNSGMISSTKSASGIGGIVLKQGGAITNNAGGTISGELLGAYIGGTHGGYLTNSGTIKAIAKNGVAVKISAANAGLVNSGLLAATTSNGVGVELYGGNNSFSNTGTVLGAGAVGAVIETYGTIINAGTISDTASSALSGGIRAQGGTITNNAGGLIKGVQGIYNQGVGVTTVFNFGTIKGTGSNGWGAVGLRASGNVTNAAGGVLEGYAGVMLQGVTGDSLATVLNQGTIIGTALNGAVYLGYAGQVSNAVGGTISGAEGVELGVASTTLVNTGSITGTLYGVQLQPGGTVINTVTGTNAGYIGGVSAGIRSVNGGPNTIINAGTIKGTRSTSSGVYFANSIGLVTNQGSGLIEGGYFGVLSAYQTVTLTNAGTIEGTIGFYARDTFSGAASSNTVINAGTVESSNGGAGVAVSFGAANDRLIVDPGAVFTGTVNGGGGTNTLELATGAGTLDALGTQFTNFQTLLVDANAQWTLTGTPSFGAGKVIDFASDNSLLQFTPGSISATFDGFATGDTIELTGVADATGVNLVNTNTLEVSRAGNPAIYLTLNPSQSFTGATFNYATQGGNALITADDLACFAEGSRIETANGPVAVQDLRVGDRIRTASGALCPMTWIGWRRIDPRRHPDPARVQPIRICRHAFGEDVPCRDLRLSPDHAVWVDGVLVPVRLLANGATIIRETECSAITYYHVELDAHDILLAEQLPTESYLDTGNRAMFEDAGPLLTLHPTFANDQARRLAGSCAPLADDAARIAPIWHRLAGRAVALGHRLPARAPSTSDPDLRIVAGGRVHMPLHHDGARYRFMLAAGPRAIRLISRSAAPCDAQPWLEDRRQLGIMVRRMTVTCGNEIETIPLDHPACGDGWWPVERDAAGMWRWTCGNAGLTLPARGLAMLEIEATPLIAYPGESRDDQSPGVQCSPPPPSRSGVR